MDITQIELEEKIRRIVAEDNGRVVIFEYLETTPDILPIYTRLIVSTLNQSTKEVSVMWDKGDKLTKAECLQCVVNYLELIRPHEDNYIVNWSKKGSGDMQISYYGGNDMQEVLDKFFATRKKEEYVIHSITIAPYGD